MAKTCEYLAPLEDSIVEEGIAETYSGQAWSENCRMWVYFRCVLDLASLRKRFDLPDFVKDHSHFGTHDGQESGFVCTCCNDAVMGHHPQSINPPRTFG
ncbi:MAG: hypothetical protein AAGB26_01880 [Planctomycetota bacterium]